MRIPTDDRMSTQISLLAFVAVAMLVLSGCEGNHYEIELKPQDSGMERSLTAWRSGSKEQVSGYRRKTVAALRRVTGPAHCFRPGTGTGPQWHRRQWQPHRAAQWQGFQRLLEIKQRVADGFLLRRIEVVLG